MSRCYSGNQHEWAILDLVFCSWKSGCSMCFDKLKWRYRWPRSPYSQWIYSNYQINQSQLPMNWAAVGPSVHVCRSEWPCPELPWIETPVEIKHIFESELISLSYFILLLRLTVAAYRRKFCILILEKLYPTNNSVLWGVKSSWCLFLSSSLSTIWYHNGKTRKQRMT